ncbi:hypothetical protein L1887_04482 [Cichorium endivia]|nr:hypothetical protein L1887_04482 [Cichorium endivia]
MLPKDKPYKGEMSQVCFDISSLGGGVCYGGICLPWAYTSYLFKLEVAQPIFTISFQYPDIYIGRYRKSRSGPPFITLEGKDQETVQTAIEALSNNLSSEVNQILG